MSARGEHRSPAWRRWRRDGVAGLVLGVHSVPDGLATGILAGVNPLAGLYAYLVGALGGAAATSSTFMVVQGTGAMAMVLADVPQVHDGPDAERALFTLSVLTGVVMLVAGALKLGSVLRFVANAVMVGFISAIGVNIALGQVANLTGYAADGSNRVVRAVRTALSPGQLHWPSIVVGLVTIGLILVLERTPVGALGLVVAVLATSGATALLGWSDVATLDGLGVELDGLPVPTWPLLGEVPALVVPAVSLAFVGLVQGAGISASSVNPDGRYPDASRDFVGQGVANVASGVFQGMPVGGSMSASALSRAAGAQTRLAPVVAAAVMAAVILLLGDEVGSLAMPSLAGLLILVGIRTVRVADLRSVWRTGPVQKAVVGATFGLTMVVPLQYAVIVGVTLSVVLHAVRQSNRVTVRRRVRDADGHVLEVDPPGQLRAAEVVVLQPYGSLFFAAAPAFEAALPEVAASSTGSVVILRLRSRSDLGTTFMEAVRRYALNLDAVGSRLLIVSTNERIEEQLLVTGVVDVIGADALYRGDERLGAALARAEADAAAWVDERRGDAEGG